MKDMACQNELMAYTHTLLSQDPMRTAVEPGSTARLDRGWEQYVIKSRTILPVYKYS